MDTKYVVYKRDEFNSWMDGLLPVDKTRKPHVVADAVVIRKQDVFAPPALDAYSNAILTTVEGLQQTLSDLPESVMPNAAIDSVEAVILRLQTISDYFHQQAEDAWHSRRKLPD